MNKPLNKAFQDVRSGNIAPVYMLIGDEEWGKSKFLALLKRTVVDQSMADFNFEHLRAGEVSGVAVVDRARELPVMADRRLILVDACELWKKKDVDQIVKYFEGINDKTCLVLQFASADRRKKVFQAKSGGVRYLEFLRPKSWELHGYIAELARDMNIKLTQEALALVAELAGDDLSKVYRELDKLSLFKLDRGTIEAPDVELLMGRTRHATRWELNEFIGNRDLAGALIKIHHILEGGEEPIGLLSTLNMFLKQLLLVKLLLSNGVRDPQEIAGTMGVPFKIAGALMRQQQKFSGVELRRAFQLLRETDFRLKSSGMDRKLIIDHLVTRLLAPSPFSPPPLNKRQRPA